MGMPATQDCNPLYDDLNAGKKDISIDITKPEGMAAFHKLLATADVFLTNNRPQALKKNGLDYDTLKEIVAGISYQNAKAYFAFDEKKI
jgi:crotonobetainyl-CoA:carnitine CoA-transferase CaiB-like acyl-CoA transferase